MAYTDKPRKGQRFRSPAFQGAWILTAGNRYSSGKWHGAWDVGCPIGTPVTAPVDATVGDMNDGVRNQPVGVPGGPGSPANWVLLHYRSPRYGPVTLWYQHLNKGVPVRRGQRVKAGQVIGYSGNSGNTYGPHLHLQAMRGYRRGTGRWVIYSDRSQNIFHPSASWAGMSTSPTPGGGGGSSMQDRIRRYRMFLALSQSGKVYYLVGPTSAVQVTKSVRQNLEALGVPRTSKRIMDDTVRHLIGNPSARGGVRKPGLDARPLDYRR